MRQIVTVVLVMAGVLGSAVPSALNQIASAEEGWGGSAGMRGYRMLPEMMRGMGMPGPWGYGRGGHEGPLISMMLHWKDQLALTANQERSLREIRANFEKEAIKRTSDIDVAELELKELLEQEKVDLIKAEASTKKIALLRADLRLARIKTIEAGKALLTSEQQRKLERLGHDSRMGEPGRGMTGPGMRPAPPLY
ncbi:MAG: periplasmic heavy metal sensor [Candidatus Methylomirabilis oxyfera]|nr:periplasmic heavy metal sensor [Candidatus Methylomirabilis oxyfera]